ncbi:MAG: hypothetical protein EPO40_27205 [Myxococcaceae bacterium]|nr:MAG: hypothetical protein EPO40_27205 [Myxococcaceae bacterium]
MQVEQDGRPHVVAGAEGQTGAELDALADVVARLEGEVGVIERTRAARAPDVVARAWALRDRDAGAFGALCSQMKTLGVIMSVWERDVRAFVPAPRGETGAPSPGAGWRSPAPPAPVAAPAEVAPRPYASARFDDPDDLSDEAMTRSGAEQRVQLARYFGDAAAALDGNDRDAARRLAGPGSATVVGAPDVVVRALRAIGKGKPPAADDLKAARTALARGPEAVDASDEGAVNDPAPSWAAELGIVERTGADAAADAREGMREASREGAPDPLDGLPERITSESNPALAFDALVIGELCTMAEEEPAAYQSERAKLRAVGVGVTALDKAVEAERQRRKRAAKEAEREGLARAKRLRREGEEAERAATAEKLKAVRGERPELAAHFNQRSSNGATFTMEPGRVVMDAPTSQGTKRTTLANFSAPIVAHTLELDAPDAKPRGTYTLSVVMEGSETPREVDVEAERFARMEWVETALGPRAVVAPGKGARDNLRAALGYLSSPVTRQRCGFTGWVRHEGRWVYLHAGGAIGDEGAVEGLAATPPAPVDRFALPAPPVGSELERAVGAVVELLSMEPAAATVPMVALAFHAPLGGSRCAVHVNGPADLGKSVRASLVQRLFGAGMHSKAPPVSWADGSTAVGISQVLARAGDALVMMDDLRVSGGSRDEAEAAKVDRVLRAHFNGASPLKGRREGGGRTDPASRCNVLSTGETLPKGSTASTLNRVVTVELDAPLPASIGELDAMASGGVLAAGMAAYLRWLAPQVEDLRPRARAEERAAAARWGFSEKSRATELLGGLCLGMEYLLRFLAASGVSTADVERHRARALAALHDVAGEHGARVAEEGIAARFVGLVAQGLRSGLAHVVEVRRAEAPGTGLRNLTPEDPLLWGYQRRAGDLSAAGPLIGYLIRTATPAKPSPITDAVCLAPGAALSLAKKVERENGRTLGADPKAIGAALAAAGMLARTELDGARRRETTRVRTSSGGPLLEVWALKLSALGYGASEPDDGGDEPSPAPVDDGTGPAPEDVPEFPSDVDPFAP